MVRSVYISGVLAALAALCIGPVHANDLNVYVKVLDCKGQTVNNTIVTLSGCVDCVISTSTNGNGTAAFTGTQYSCQGGEGGVYVGGGKSIQYCFGTGNKNCSFNATVDGINVTSELTLPGTTIGVNPQDYICQVIDPTMCSSGSFQCRQDNLTAPAPVILAPPPAQCPRPSPSPSPSPSSSPSPPPSPSPSPSPSPPPLPTYDATGDTCIAFFPALYTATIANNPSGYKVLSASFTSKQKNDDANGIILNSGSAAMTATPASEFGRILKSQRWDWETRWLVPATGSLTQTGTMYCGQNKAAGRVTVTVNSDKSLTYSITMGVNHIQDGEVHIGVACTSPDRDNVPFGTLNCNPGSTGPGCTNMYSVSGTSISGNITLNPTCTGKIYTIIHIGF